MRPKPNTRVAVALALSTEDDSAFDLIRRAEAIRSDEAKDLVLRAHLRRYSDLLRSEVYGRERSRPDWTLNVRQPYAPCYVTRYEWRGPFGARAIGPRTICNPKASDVRRQAQAERRERAERRKTGVLEGAERPRTGVVVLGTEQARSLGLGSMAWLANE